jgi:TP901 family phage tail tape measure protein
MANGMNISFRISAIDDFSREMSRVGRAITDATGTAGILGSTFGDVGNVASTSFSEVVDSLTDTSSTLQEVIDAAGESAEAFSINAEAVTATAESMDNAGASAGTLMQRLESVSGELAAVGSALSVAGLAIAGGLGFAVNTSMDFEAQISRVGAIAGATGQDLDALRDSALELGASSSKSASEIAQGQEALAAMGFTAVEIIGAMPGVIAAAEASGSDMAQTADVMASTLSIFSMEAEKASYVADILAKTANISAASLTDMQYALKYAGPPAAALGIGLEDLSAAIGLMTNAGMGGEQAGTTLRAALLGLLDPSEENAKMMKNMGIAITDAAGNFVGLPQLIENFQTSMSGMTETQKAANLASLVGSEAVSGMLTLMKAGPAEINKMADALRNSGGASAEAAAKMKDNLKGAVDELGGSFETLLITVGTALTPAVQFLAVAMQGLLDKFNGLPDYMQTTLAVLAALTALFLLIIGPILLIIAIIPSITAGFTAIATAAGMTTAALASTIGIVLGVVAALVIIGIALVAAYNEIGWFRDMVDAAWAWIKNVWNTALEFISGIVKSVMSSVASFIGDRLNDIKAWWNENGQAIMELAKSAWSVIKGIIQANMGYISMIFQTVFPIIVGVVKVAWAVIQAVFSTVINVILGIIGFWAKVFTGDFTGAMETVKETARRIWNNIVDIFEGIDLKAIGKNIIQGLINGITSMASSVGKAVLGVANAIPSKIKSFLGIHSPSRVLMELGEFTGEGFVKGIGSMIRDVSGISAEMASAAVPSITTQSSYKPSAETARQNSTPINLTLNYNGTGAREDAVEMLNVIERGLNDRLGLKLRLNGVR